MIIEDHIVLQMVTSIRKDHPRMGVRKIYFMIKGEMGRMKIKMGRDALFDLMAAAYACRIGKVDILQQTQILV